MEFTSFSWEINSIEDPSIPQHFYFHDCFSIIFSFTKELIQITQPTSPTSDSEVDFSSTTLANEAFLVPSDILCNCTPFTDLNGENTAFLHDVFSSLPLSRQILDQILPAMGETARTIRSREGCDSSMPEIVVNLYITTHIVVEDSDFYNDDLRQNVPELAQLVNLLERPRIDKQEDDAEQQCAICLEEFGQSIEDSSVEVVRTNCSHVFHESCIFRWLRRCADRQSPYSCPLCRCSIFPTSQMEEE
ncbi:E3 ubiquitin-protein ligase AIRP1-like [Arachis stenosperma]|uniref:E3 ubiquitin-protein ligase AIRP1-like n=1 Tax=Arachis stenosperma TaxID=217475 RepID=UPI0025AD4B8B|nr:E3 ubiquitin-protein ligase AIRP1-like [Arachis stenosperma]